MWGVMGMIAAPVIGVVWVLVVRVTCEFVLLRFRTAASPACPASAVGQSQ
ncbi:DUF4282 domain-containing protein [Actinomadura sp. 6N118]